MTDEASTGEPHDLQRVPPRGTARMIVLVLAVPVVVLFGLWALVRVTALPQVPTSEILDLTCDTTDEVTVFRGSVAAASLRKRDFETATLRVEFFAFLVREENTQQISLTDSDVDTGLIDIEITQQIDGPANCEVVSFQPE